MLHRLETRSSLEHGVILGVLLSRTSFPPVWGGAGKAKEVAGEAGEKGTDPKPATTATKQANANFAKTLPFADKRDFELAKRGKIADLPDGGVVKNDKGQIVWDPRTYDFIKFDQAAPDTVNPSLWRIAQVMSITGLFKVTDNIYQIRGYDLSNITFIEGKDGVTIVDPLISRETAKAGLNLYYQHRPKKPVVAVIHTHSHIDHYGGVRGVISEAEVNAGKCRIIAPEHFTEEAVSENVIAGNAMGRRASYMYGPLLPKNAVGQVTSGLGLTTSSGVSTLIRPTEFVTKTGQKLTIDGLTYEFLMAPASKAPAEMHFFIHEHKALCSAENSVHTLHNFYTLRGAKTRDSRSGQVISLRRSTCGATRPRSYLRRTTGQCGATPKLSIISRNTVTPSSTFTTRCCGSPTTGTP